MIIKLFTLNEYFNDKIKNLKCEKNTQQYIVNTFSNFKNYELLNKSLTLAFSEAKFKVKFENYQNIGDYILIMESIFPENLSGAIPEYYYSLAQISYFKCYIILKRSWPIFEELADRLPEIIKELQNYTLFK